MNEIKQICMRPHHPINPDDMALMTALPRIDGGAGWAVQTNFVYPGECAQFFQTTDRGDLDGRQWRDDEVVERDR